MSGLPDFLSGEGPSTATNEVTQPQSSTVEYPSSSASPAPTMAILPPEPIGGQSQKNAEGVNSSLPSTSAQNTQNTNSTDPNQQHPQSQPSQQSQQHQPSQPRGSRAWNLMGGMAGSFVTSARDVVSHAANAANAAASAKKETEPTTPKDAANGQGGNATTAANKNDSNNSTDSKTHGGTTMSSFASLSSSVSQSISNLPPMNMPAITNIPTMNIPTPLTHTLNALTTRSTIPTKTTASQVLMFRQLLHTHCRPGLRLSRGYEGTAAQKAVLHMPWWERGIETTKKMVISYDNLITRLWLSGCIMPFEEGGFGEHAKGGWQGIEGSAGVQDGKETKSTGSTGVVDTLINERGLPPIPHHYWIDRLGFQQDDPVTDFRSGGVLSLAMLVHIVESCPNVHSRFVPKRKSNNNINEEHSNTKTNDDDDNPSLEQILLTDASLLPFGITCINITSMLSKFLLFSKSIDKMDALLSAKPFWNMFVDPNAMLVLQEVSLDLLCDVVLEIGRERRLRREDPSLNNNPAVEDKKKKGKMHGMHGREGKVTVFDFAEIMERTEKRVGEELLGAGPQNVEELRAVARRVKSKYLMRIQAKENHLGKGLQFQQFAQFPSLGSIGSIGSIGSMKSMSTLTTKDSVKQVTSSVMGGVGAMGGLVSMWKPASKKEVDGNSSQVAGASNNEFNGASATTSSTPIGENGENVEIQYKGESATSQVISSANDALDTNDAKSPAEAAAASEVSAVAEAFDLLGGDFDDMEHSEQEILDAMDKKLDPAEAFVIDDDDF